jgi:hypothetical protein
MAGNIYKILKSFPTIAIVNNYDFIKNGEYKITETNKYSTYNIRRKKIILNYLVQILLKRIL